MGLYLEENKIFVLMFKVNFLGLGLLSFSCFFHIFPWVGIIIFFLSFWGMWGSFLIKKDNCKNLTKWILLTHNVQGLTCILQDLWKLSKVRIYFKTSQDAFKSYSCHWDLWLLGYRFHGSISSIIWFLFFFGKLTYVLKEEDTNIIRGIPQIYNDNRNIKQQMATG